MKKQIRQNVFETNSSSSHSVSIADNNKQFVMDNELLPDQDGVIELTGGEFGWDYQKYNDALTKANYLSVYSRNDEAMRNLLIEVIKKQTGAEKVLCLGVDEWESPNHSYIDHQSDVIEGGAAGVCFDSEETMRQFIFNKNSWLFTGNDNENADPTFYDVPEYKDGKVIKTIYKYELRVVGYKKTTRFKHAPSEEELSDAFDSLLSRVYLTDSGHFDDDNSIAMQILRDDRKCFKFEGYDRSAIDFENKTLLFKKEAFNDAKKIHEKKYPNADWYGEDGYSKCREIEDELYAQENSPYVKKVEYLLIDIQLQKANNA